MVGYSGTPLPKKLGINTPSRIKVVRPPENFDLSELGVPAEDEIDVAVAFCLSHSEMVEVWKHLPSCIRPAGGLWICWPKKASKVTTDLNDSVVRNYGLDFGWVDNKVCAINDVFSGLRFVRRLRDR